MSSKETNRPIALSKATMAKINKIYEDSKILIDMLEDRLAPERLEELQEYSFAGELGLLMDTMFAALIKRQIPITKVERDKLSEILAMFGTEERDCDFLNDKENTVAALNVID